MADGNLAGLAAFVDEMQTILVANVVQIFESQPGNDLMTKMLEIKAKDSENWLRRLARLISPQSWETL